MTTLTTPAPDRTAARPGPGARAGLAGALRSEITKIRSTRSTWWTLIALTVVTIGIGTLTSFGAVSSHQGGPGFDATSQSLAGLLLGQLVIAVLGALTITSEYSTGMIRTSLTAQPRRSVVYAAKAIVFGATALLTGLIASIMSFFIGQAIMSSHHINATLGQPHVLRAVIGGALFLAACGLLAFGLGMILRHTASTISAAVALLLVLSILVNVLPQSWQDHVDKWMPSIAGSQIWTTKPSTMDLPPWQGIGVLAGYAAIAMIIGFLLFRRRDA
jgi:ABC-type transport system involved in multi-copper enzyme maturation permease subunit